MPTDQPLAAALIGARRYLDRMNALSSLRATHIDVMEDAHNDPLMLAAVGIISIRMRLVRWSNAIGGSPAEDSPQDTRQLARLLR